MQVRELFSNVLIVGAGQAGARAAKAMRDAGFTGSIQMIGDEAHLPYERPPLSKSLLLNARHPTPFVFTPDFYAELDIKVETSATVEAIEREGHAVRLRDGREIGYDKLLLATGSRLRPFAIDGMPPDRILSLRTLDDSRALERRLASRPKAVVVGGGFIGLEVAATMNQRGAAVTVVESADRLLPRLGCPEASQLVLYHHRAAGIDIRLSTRVLRADEGHLILSDGSRVQADLVVAGVGVVPNTCLAEEAGLDVNGGIVVDEHGRSSDPDIYAAGDVTRHFNRALQRHVRLESWQNANLQAETAGRSMMGLETTGAEIPWLWSDQGSLNVQTAGVPDAVNLTVVRGGSEPQDGIAVLQLRDGVLVGGVTLNRGKEMPHIRRLLAWGKQIRRPEEMADIAVPLRRFMPATSER